MRSARQVACWLHITGRGTFLTTRMTLVCPVWIHSREIELRVAATSSGSWHWMIRIPDGQVFRQGTMDGQTAAQVAAQCAFEERLQRASLNRYFPPGGYHWKQV